MTDDLSMTDHSYIVRAATPLKTFIYIVVLKTDTQGFDLDFISTENKMDYWENG